MSVPDISEEAVEAHCARFFGYPEDRALIRALRARVTELEREKSTAIDREHNAHLAVKEERALADAAEARATAAEQALREIARQRLHAEITDTDPDELDWLGGYEACVKTARKALGAQP